MAVLLVILAAVIAELYVIVQVAHHIGFLWTFALLVLISASGPWLVRRTGMGVWRRARGRLDAGEVPGREIVDGVLLLAAGLFLTVPGFLSGVAGILLLLPPVRAVVRLLGSRWLARRAVIQVWSDGRGHDPSGERVITATSRPVEHRPGRDAWVLDRGVDRPGPRADQPQSPEQPQDQARPLDETRPSGQPDRPAGG